MRNPASNSLPVFPGGSSSSYECLLGTMPGVVYSLDEAGHFTWVGESAGTLLGFSREDLVGKHFSTIIHPEDLPSVSREYLLPKFAGVPTGGERAPKLFDERRSWPRKTSGLQVRMQRKADGKRVDDDVVMCKVNASGQYSDENRFCGTVGIIYDAVDDEFRTVSAGKANRYNAFDLLTHALSHVFSNVFTGIYGNLQLIEMQLEDPGEFSDNLEAIRHSIESALSLVKRLAGTISTRSDLDPSGLDTILRAEADDILGGRQLQYAHAIADGLWRIQVDSDYLRHIFRAVFFHIARAMHTEYNLEINIENIAESPIELPRIDCPYIRIAFAYRKNTINDEFENDDSASSLERIASMALSYELLKKVGGTVDVSDVGGNGEVQLYLPALFPENVAE